MREDDQMGFKGEFNFLYDNFANGHESKADFMVALFSSMVNEDKSDCSFFTDHKAKFYDNILSSDGKTFNKEHLRYFKRNLSVNTLDKFFISRLPDSGDAQDQLAKELGFDTEKNFPDEDVIVDKVIEGFIATMKTLLPSESAVPKDVHEPSDAVKELDAYIAAIPKPTPIPVPDDIDEEREHTYINALYDAYGDDAGYEINADNCSGEYAEDLSERRIDFFAAESIRCSIDELCSAQLGGQFDVLKSETWNGVKNTYRKVARDKSMNGYDRMLEVMDKAAAVPVDAYILSSSKYWISNKVKQGVCHFLVNDKKMVWKQ